MISEGGIYVLGCLEFVPGSRGRGTIENLFGLSVLAVRTDPSGWMGRRRLNRAGTVLRRRGAVRTLLPRDFERWDFLERFGLRPVEPAPFLRAQAPALALVGLRRRNLNPERATVVLSGTRTDGDMFRTAAVLCPKVRHLVISAPGGKYLAQRLRDEFGIPVLPPGEVAQMELCFHPGGKTGPGACLELYGREPELDGGRLFHPGLGELGGNLDLLCALWERGKLDVQGLKFT